jgi:adenylate cyclase
LYKTKNVWIDIAAPEVSILTTFAASAIWSYYTEGKARKYLRNVFGRYLSPMVITEILNREKEPELGGSQIEGTVFFSDIKNFTSISESMLPADVVNLLNNYFSLATDVLMKNDGLLDKYIGDAIMAVFGAPIEKKNHASLACKTVLDINRVMNSDYREGKIKIQLETRFGIASGPMVVGNIGSERRLDYTAIGDTVNLASRLEGVNKMYGTTIMMSEETRKIIGEDFPTREIDTIRVKGKNQPICIYELFDPVMLQDDSFQRCLQYFAEGLRHYKNGNFRDALIAFQSGRSYKQDDGPTNVFIKKCESFITSPPHTGWDGVTSLESK